MSEEGKKIKGKLSEFYLFLGIFNTFLTKTVYTFREDLCHVGGQNKKKAAWSVFFLVRPDFSSSEESSTVKYSECAPMVKFHSDSDFHIPQSQNYGGPQPPTSGCALCIGTWHWGECSLPCAFVLGIHPNLSLAFAFTIGIHLKAGTRLISNLHIKDECQGWMRRAERQG